MSKIFKKALIAFIGVAFLGFGLTSCYDKFDPESYAPPLNIGGFSSASEVAPSNLIAYWSFDGHLLDSISNTAGTNVGTSYANGLKGRAMQGAVDGYVLFDPTPAILGMQSFTISCWANSPLNENGIVGLVNLSNTEDFWGNIDMFIENGSTLDAGKFRVHITNGDKDTWVEKDGIPGMFNSWNNFAVSYDAATETFKFYVNGALQVTKQVAGFGPIQFTDSGPMVFGTVQFQTDPSLTSSHGAESWASYLVGQLDEVRIYDKALSDTEVNSLVKLEGRGK